MIRKIDELGRIVIPMEFRNFNNWNPGDNIEIIENEDEIILRKHIDKECKKCNNGVHKKDKYCSNCGTKLK